MPDDHDIRGLIGRDYLRRTLVYRQVVRECGDPEKALRMAEDFDAHMRSLVMSARVGTEATEALTLAIDPDFRAFEEWKRSHPVTWRLRRLDAMTDEAMVAVGSWLLRRFPWLRRLA